MATSALDGKQRVYTLLTNALSAEPVEVTYGAVRSPKRSWAFVGAVTYVESDWAAVGAHKRTESYEVAVTVNVIAASGSSSDAETSALHYVDVFETALRADASLGGLTAQGAALIPRTFKSQPITDGAECQWEGVVRISGVRI